MLRRLSIGPLDKSADIGYHGPLWTSLSFRSPPSGHHDRKAASLAEMNRRLAVYLKCSGQYPIISTPPTAKVTLRQYASGKCFYHAQIHGKMQTSCHRRLNSSSMILSSNVGVECRATRCRLVQSWSGQSEPWDSGTRSPFSDECARAGRCGDSAG